MQLNTRQERVYTLANILGSGKPVSAQSITATLACSEPTLSRALKELRKPTLLKLNTVRLATPIRW